MRGTRVRETPRGSGVWKAAAGESYEGRLLLDTHIWIWWLEDDKRQIAPVLRTLLAQVSRKAGLVVCDISFWETALKAARGKLTLSRDPVSWLHDAENAPAIDLLPLDREILVRSARLPRELRDPADRMLVAAAQIHGLSLVTMDERIIAYARAHPEVGVCDARPSGRVREARRRVGTR